MNDKTLSIIIKAQDQASKTMESIGDKIEHVGRVAARAAAIGLTAATAATAAMGVAAIKSAGNYEQSRVAFDTMLGSADKARSLMADIAQFAKSTPFELPEIVNASKSLLAFGVSAKDIIPTMRRLGDVSAGLNIPVGELSELYGKAKVQGRLFMEDINQLTGRGIPIYQALAKVTGQAEGKIRDMVEAGKIGFPELESAFKVMTDKGSQFGGMMDKQSQTFNGVVSNIKDGFGQILRSAVGIKSTGDIVAGGIFDRIKNAANDMLPAIAQATEDIGPAVQSFVDTGIQIGSRIEEGIRKRVDQFHNIASIMAGKLQDGNFVGVGEQIVTGLLNGLKSIALRAGELYQALSEMMGKVDWMGLGITFGSKVLPGLAIGIIAGVANVDFGTLISGVMAHWEQILIGALTIMFLPAKFVGWIGAIFAKIPFAGKLIEWGITHLNEFGQALLSKLGEWLGLFGSAFVDRLGLAGQRIIPAFIQFLRSIPEQITNASRWVDDRIGQMMISMGNRLAELGPRQIVEKAQSIRSAIETFFSGASGWLRNAGGQVIDGFIAGLRDKFGAVKQTLGELTKKLTQWKGPASLDKVILTGAGQMVMAGFINGLESMYSQVQGSLSGLTSSLPGAIQSPIISATQTGINSPTPREGIGLGSTFNMYGNVNLGSADAVDRFFERLNAQKEMGALGVGV